VTSARFTNFIQIVPISLLLVVLAITTSQGSGRPQEVSPAPHVNSARLQGTLEKLSEFGRNSDGGVTRLGFSNEDMAAREYVMGLMRDAQLEVRVDPAGNIFGHRAGSEKLPVLLFGSHIDSVIHGGNFDGDVGSMGAIEVIRALNEHKIVTRHPLEIVVWTNEEGNHFGLGTFGSGVAGGLIGTEALERKDEKGLTLADWLRKYGQDPAHFLEARIPRTNLAGYVELHIEQGGVLDAAGIPIGVVQGIVGIKRRDCIITGFANHAGTTPMDKRQDALAAAARDALALREETRRNPGKQVGTVGVMKVEPGAPNVVPGRAQFTVDMRDLKTEVIDEIWARVQRRFDEISMEEKVTTACTLIDTVDPAETDTAFKSAIREAATSAGLATRDLPSGAGHDAQNVARIAPIGMIFVPSRGGISHSPKEYSTWPHVAGGAEVLYRTILLLDARLHHN
jgi:N-carbamoyl-L-amino-acid hydrolase